MAIFGTLILIVPIDFANEHAILLLLLNPSLFIDALVGKVSHELQVNGTSDLSLHIQMLLQISQSLLFLLLELFHGVIVPDLRLAHHLSSPACRIGGGARVTTLILKYSQQVFRLLQI